jgi:hypothetical protein
MIAEGWQPVGGIAIDQQNPTKYWYFQAMVRYG